MACEDKKTAFDSAMAACVQELKDGLAGVARDAEAKANKVADEAEDGSDLAQGVGAVAGTVIGGTLGGPAGAAAGATVGKVIGALFTMKVEMHRAEFKLDLPSVTMKDQRWSFDAPEVTMKDKEMSFDLPVTRMERRRGPDVPRTVCRMETREVGLGIKIDVPVCYIEMEPTYLDVPVTVMEPQRIVIGLPEVAMKRHEIVVGVPEIRMQTQIFAFDVPRIVFELAQDAGKKAAEAAMQIATEAQVAAVTKEHSLREQMRFKLVGPCNEMFDCYRGQLTTERDRTVALFDPAIAQITSSIQAALSRGLPEGDVSIQSLRATLTRVTADRDKALAGIDEALKQLGEAAAKALDQFVNKDG